MPATTQRVRVWFVPAFLPELYRLNYYKDYLNQNYYAVKINAESKLPFTFNGKKYEYLPDVKMNELAVELLMGQYSYPTTVIMEKNKLSVIPISGYLSPKDIEPILKYFIEGVDKGIGYKEWEKSLKKEW